MTAIKTVTMTVRLNPMVKKGLVNIAEKEHRSIANMIEVMILDYCKRNEITIPEQATLLIDQRKK